MTSLPGGVSVSKLTEVLSGGANEPPRRQIFAAARLTVALQPPAYISGIDFKINVRNIY